LKNLLLLAGTVALTACSSDQEDLQGWMAQQEKTMKATVKPLPEVKPFPPVAYQAGAVSPFAAERIEPETKAGATGGPDLDRRREPLEAFPLESLQLVGVMMQGRKEHALVKADKSLYQVRVGNYMGQNFGLVTDIADTEITLKELVEDLNGDWVERSSKLQLQERQEKTK
jgi:type IV pilus assembly protein PilP